MLGHAEIAPGISVENRAEYAQKRGVVALELGLEIFEVDIQLGATGGRIERDVSSADTLQEPGVGVDYAAMLGVVIVQLGERIVVHE